MLTSNGHTTAGVINKNIQFDPVKDFAGVSKIASVPMVAVVPPDLQVKSLKDFITVAKERPGKLNSSSAGLASTTFLSAELLKQGSGIDIVHVPYKGTPEATTAVVRGDVQMYFTPIPMAQELSAAGKVRPSRSIPTNAARSFGTFRRSRKPCPATITIRGSRFSRPPTRRAKPSAGRW